jgi:hypothetical protein
MERHEVEIGDCVQVIDVAAEHDLAGKYGELMTEPVKIDEQWQVGVRIIPNANTGYLPLANLRWVGKANMVRSVMINTTGRDNWAPRMIIRDEPDSINLLTGATIALMLMSSETHAEPEPEPAPSIQGEGGEAGGAGASGEWQSEEPATTTEEATTTSDDTSTTPSDDTTANTSDNTTPSTSDDSGGSTETV